MFDLLRRTKGDYGTKEQFDEVIEVIRKAATESRMINEVEGDMETIAQN